MRKAPLWKILHLVNSLASSAIGVLMVLAWLLFFVMLYGADFASSIAYGFGISEEFRIPILSQCSEFLSYLSYQDYASLLVCCILAGICVNFVAVIWGFAALLDCRAGHFAPLFGILLNTSEIAFMALIIVADVIL
ncbi:MAG: hypothetical protein A2X49_04350 [Lentisphaerae bacterium GWF2_52_8]|nr:MAG: hypothetical protein A2X49_04350 [Lentisphaerae bacterium GWF2_52_8]